MVDASEYSRRVLLTGLDFTMATNSAGNRNYILYVCYIPKYAIPLPPKVKLRTNVYKYIWKNERNCKNCFNEMK